jgi:hypothetical protein
VEMSSRGQSENSMLADDEEGVEWKAEGTF